MTSGGQSSSLRLSANSASARVSPIFFRRASSMFAHLDATGSELVRERREYSRPLYQCRQLDVLVARHDRAADRSESAQRRHALRRDDVRIGPAHRRDRVDVRADCSAGLADEFRHPTRLRRPWHWRAVLLKPQRRRRAGQIVRRGDRFNARLRAFPSGHVDAANIHPRDTASGVKVAPSTTVELTDVQQHAIVWIVQLVKRDHLAAHRFYRAFAGAKAGAEMRLDTVDDDFAERDTGTLADSFAADASRFSHESPIRLTRFGFDQWPRANAAALLVGIEDHRDLFGARDARLDKRAARKHDPRVAAFHIRDGRTVRPLRLSVDAERIRLW